MVVCRGADYTMKVANDLAPGADVSGSFLPGNDPMSNYPSRRHLLAEFATNPAGVEYTVTWPPADSNATALRFQSSLATLFSSSSMPDSVLGVLGPASVPPAAVRITTTYAPPPPVQSPPPPPSAIQPPAPDGPLPPSPSSQSTPPIQVSFAQTLCVDPNKYLNIMYACWCKRAYV